MLKAGMITALVAGILALIIGIAVTFFVGTFGAAAGAAGATGFAARSAVVVVALLGLPVMAIVGAALAHSNPGAAIWLTGIPGALIAVFSVTGQEFNALLLVIGLALVAAAWMIRTGAADGGTPAA